MWQSIVDFFSHSFFIVLGGIMATITAIFVLYTAYLFTTGLLPVLYRLGINLSKRKIVIFADERFGELKKDLTGSKIFRSKNIEKMEKSEIKRIKQFELIIVHYKSSKDILEKLLDKKEHSSALIVYAPPDEGSIDDKTRENINSAQNATIVNFKGRLLSDILASMITTGYIEKKK